jgi:hypothetical protein
MSSTSNYMKLTVWDQGTDLFNYTELANNFTRIDAHNHANGNGVQISADGIASASITNDKLASASVDYTNLINNSVRTAAIQDANVTKSKLDYSTINALTTGSTLPTTSIDGYTIQYTDSTSAPTYIWSLKRNIATSSWSFAGGTPATAYSYSSISAPSSAPSAGSWYSTWGGTSLINKNIPVAGTYLMTYSATMGMTTSNTNATIGAALQLGTSGNGSTAVPISKSGAYVPVDMTSTNKYATITNQFIYTATSSATIQLLLGIVSVDTGSANASIQSQSLSIIPLKL